MSEDDRPTARIQVSTSQLSPTIHKVDAWYFVKVAFEGTADQTAYKTITAARAGAASVVVPREAGEFYGQVFTESPSDAPIDLVVEVTEPFEVDLTEVAGGGGVPLPKSLDAAVGADQAIRSDLR